MEHGKADTPVNHEGVNMGDVICARCGEPWEYYYVIHEMGEFSRENLLHGRWCPSCKGKHNNELNEEHEVEHLRSLMDSTDLDPTEYI